MLQRCCRLSKVRLCFGLCLSLPYIFVFVFVQLIAMPPDGASGPKGTNPAAFLDRRLQMMGGSQKGVLGLGEGYASRVHRWKGVPPLRPDCSPLKFTNSSTTPLTAIASFPGSGNTWLRHLIQQATGYYTGSFYNDRILKRRGFPAEEFRNNSVIAVKTHEWPGKDKYETKFQKAILLLRDPYQSLVAEFNRRHGGHMGFAKHSKQSSQDFHLYTVQMAKAWLEFNLRWLNFDGPLLVVMYEDLSSNTVTVLRQVCQFLGVSLSPDTINCVKANSEGYFHRGASKSHDSAWVEFRGDVRALIDMYRKEVATSVTLRSQR